MEITLPVEIVDLILVLALQPHISQGGSVTDVKQAIVTSLLSRHHRVRFQPELYHHVALLNGESVSLFARTIAARPDLGSKVQSLAVIIDGRSSIASGPATSATRTSTNDVEGIASVSTPDALLLLSACPNVTQLLLPCDGLTNFSSGVYQLRHPKELTLVNPSRSVDVEGIVARHRDLTAAALQNDPGIRAALGTSAPSDATAVRTSDPSAPVVLSERSLSHLHLVNFEGRLLHHLALVSSITHVVLTNPLLPETRPGVPGLSIIPRSHLMLLLGSGHIARVIVRADVSTCIRLMEELAPIEDRKLIFRPFRTSADPLFRSHPSSNLGQEESALYEAVATSQLNLLGEFNDRVRLHSHRVRKSSSSSGDADTSRDSSGRRSQNTSSDSSGGSNSQGAPSSSPDEAETSRQGQRPDLDYDQYSDDEDDGSEESDAEDPPQPQPTVPHPVNRNAPPPNIPIEELLRAERFTPVGLAGRQIGRTDTQPSQNSSNAERSSSSADPTSSPSSSNATRQRRRQRINRGPFALRRNDLRGATQANLDLLSSLYEHLAANAGREQEMNFW